jgi:hypothetical protein
MEGMEEAILAGLPDIHTFAIPWKGMELVTRKMRD